jgi:hypothetical protein
MSKILMTIVCLLGTLYLRAADDVPNNPVSGELPSMLKMRISQMSYLPEGVKHTHTPWPKEASGLFQGSSKDVESNIATKEDHLAAIATIPKHLMKDRIMGTTLESNGWFYTSIEYKSWNVKEATWFNVIASKKDSKILYFSYSW